MVLTAHHDAADFAHPDLAPAIDAQTQERYARIVREAIEPYAGPIAPGELRYLDNGYRKVIFEADPGLIARAGFASPRDPVIVIALPFHAEYDLHAEYQLLTELYEREGSSTPAPVFFCDTCRSGTHTKLLGMEKVPGETLQAHVARPDARATMTELVEWEALAAGRVYAKTGLVYAEPHAKNLMVDAKAKRVRFVDVYHFQRASLDDMLGMWLEDWVEHHPELQDRDAQRRFISLLESESRSR